MKNTELIRGSYQKYPYHKGQVIDAITILEDGFVKHQDRYKVKFQCRCGNVDYRRLSDLENMQFKCCKKCGRKNNYPDKRKARGQFDENGIHIVWMTSIKDNLIRGGKIIECSITSDDLYRVLAQQNFKCAYTGIDLNVIDVHKGYSNASVDRIDSSRGYEPDNIQWVYKPVNIMKNGLSDSDFKELCYKITDFTRQS